TRSKPVCDIGIGHSTATVCALGNLAYELNRPLVWDPKNDKFKKDKAATDHLGRKFRKEWDVCPLHPPPFAVANLPAVDSLNEPLYRLGEGRSLSSSKGVPEPVEGRPPS